VYIRGSGVPFRNIQSSVSFIFFAFLE